MIRALAAHLSGESCPLAGGRRRPARRCRATEARRGQTAGPPSVQDSSHASVFHTRRAGRTRRTRPSPHAGERAGRLARMPPAPSSVCDMPPASRRGRTMRHARGRPTASRARTADLSGESCSLGTGPEAARPASASPLQAPSSGVGAAQPVSARARRTRRARVAEIARSVTLGGAERRVVHPRRIRAACHAALGGPERRVPPAGPPPRAGARAARAQQGPPRRRRPRRTGRSCPCA